MSQHSGIEIEQNESACGLRRGAFFCDFDFGMFCYFSYT